LSGWRSIEAVNGNAIYRFDRDFANAGNDSTHQYYVTPPGIDADLVVDPTTEIGTLTFRKTGLQWIYSAPVDDSNVRLSQIKDRHGNTITLSYDPSHPLRLDHITDTYGRQLSFTYNYSSIGQLTKITDATGRHWDYATDTTTSPGHPILTGFTNPDGKTTTYHYDTGALPGTWDKLDKITDARGHDISLAYSGTTGDGSQVTSVTRAVDTTSGHNIVWQFNYKPTAGTGGTCTATDWIGKTVETDPESHATTYCYNKLGQPIQVFDGNGRSVTQTYNGAANVATFTGLAGSGNPSLTTYTAAGDTTTGDLKDVTTTSGSDHQSMTYTAQGEILTSTDGNGRVTNYGYTTHFLTSVAQPAPLAAQKFTPDSLDRVASATDGNAITACPTYDGEDRVTQVVWRSGVATSASPAQAPTACSSTPAGTKWAACTTTAPATTTRPPPPGPNKTPSTRSQASPRPTTTPTQEATRSTRRTRWGRVWSSPARRTTRPPTRSAVQRTQSPTSERPRAAPRSSDASVWEPSSWRPDHMASAPPAWWVARRRTLGWTSKRATATTSRTSGKGSERVSGRQLRQNVLLALLGVFFVVLLVSGTETVPAIIGLVGLAALVVIVTRHRRETRRP
jgi:YD repeat-containing protein